MRTLPVRVDPYLLLLLALSLFALAPLATPGYFYSAHDGRHSVFFVTMFDEAIRSGALWPRWAMHHNQGYGYPTFLVQAPLAFYLAQTFIWLGFGITNAVKLAWAAGFLGGAWGMYVLVKTWILGSTTGIPARANATYSAPPTQHAAASGLVAGLLYTYAPYHLLDIYVRAAFAETMLLAWFPWVFLAFDRLIARGAGVGWQGRLLLAALSYAALLLTHVFALIAFTPLLAAFILFRLWTVWRTPLPDGDSRLSKGLTLHRLRVSVVSLTQHALLGATAALSALLLASIFLIPLFVESSVLVQEDWTRDTYDYTRHWVYWGQFFSPFWGYGYSDDPSGVSDGMGFQIGLILALLAFLAAYVLLARVSLLNARDRQLPAASPNDIHRLMLFLLLVSFAILFIISPAAEPIWRVVPQLAVIQFPWRLLILTTFTLSLLGGLLLSVLQPTTARLTARIDEEGGLLLVALLVCFASLTYSRPAALQPVEPWREDGRAVMQFEQEHPDMFGTTRYLQERFTDSPLTQQYLTADFSTDALQRLALLTGKGTVLRHYSLGHAFGGEVELVTPATIQVRLFEFPGWQVKVNGELVDHRVSPPYGLIEIDLPAGRHTIDLWMGTTPARTVGVVTTTATLLILVGLWSYTLLAKLIPKRRRPDTLRFESPRQNHLASES
jgi:hypothetical protein